MRLRQELKTYPPRVKMTVTMKNTCHDAFVLPVEIAGCSRENQLNVDITFPLGEMTITIIFSIVN